MSDSQIPPTGNPVTPPTLDAEVVSETPPADGSTYDPRQRYSQGSQGAYSQQPGGVPPYGASVPPHGYSTPGYQPPAVAQKSKILAGILAIFVGSLGIHNFYLGYTGKGLIQLLMTLLSFGFLAFVSWIWALIEGVLILTSTPGAPWHRDARGIELSD